MQEYVHNPTTVRAAPVVRPYKKVADQVPYGRVIQNRFTRKFEYIQISKPGDPGFALKAYEGDWILHYPTGCWGVMTDKQFQRYYGDGEDVDIDTAGD